MKKFVAIILCFALVLALSATAFADGITPRSTVKFKCLENCNFREGPSTSYTIMAMFEAGDFFWVKNSNAWPWYYGYADVNSNPYSVCGGRYGYAHSDYFEIYSQLS